MHEDVLIQASCRVLSTRLPGDDEEWKDLRQADIYRHGDGTRLVKDVTQTFFFSGPRVRKGLSDPAQCKIGSLQLPGLFLACEVFVCVFAVH